MSTDILSLGLDVLIIFFLIFTIYYALKLSRSLNAFRMHRGEFQALIKDLNANMEKAQSAIIDMKTASRNSGREMQDLVDESRMLIDELKLVNEAGNSIAQRLERLAEQGRAVSRPRYEEEDFADMDMNDPFDEPDDLGIPKATKKKGFLDSLSVVEKPKSKRMKEQPEPPSFFIQDRDFGDEDVDNDDQAFGSQAEKDLYEALQGRRRKS